MSETKAAANHVAVYAAIYPKLVEIAREHGYALAVHGSVRRDFDLVAIPWAKCVSSHSDLIDAFLGAFALTKVGDVEIREHGRLVVTLAFMGECFIDLSFANTDIPFFEGAVGWRARAMHELKCWPEHFGPVKDGSKLFEIRLDDRGYKNGDALLLMEWDPQEGKDDPDEGYTDRFQWCQVRSILRGGLGLDAYGLRPGYVAMGIILRNSPPENLDQMTDGEE